MMRWLVFGAAALAVSACGSAVPSSGPSQPGATPTAAATSTALPATPAAATPAPGASLAFQLIAAGQVAVYDQPAPALAVVGEQAQLVPFWGQRVAHDDPPPAVQQLDFGRNLLLWVTYGRRNTGGYGITVKAVERQGNDVVITVETRNPMPGSLLPQVITTPWEAVAVERGTLANWAALRYVVRDTGGRQLAETVPQSAGGNP